MLVDKYEVQGDLEDLKKVLKLVDWMIVIFQCENGVYYNYGIVYISVIYIVKSVLELVVFECKLGEQDLFWRICVDCYFLFVKKVVD